MPGNLYFYVNYWTILLNKTAHSKTKTPGKPFLRDLEWEFFYNWCEARGFSGFEDDKEFTANIEYIEKLQSRAHNLIKNNSNSNSLQYA